MKLLRIIASLDPRHGGPSAGLRAITPELAALGHESEFACLDAPGQVREFPGAAAIHALGPSRGGYAYARPLEPWLRTHAGDYDAVFVHGLWQHHGRAVHRALRGRRPPYFVFPHGMLDPWFRRAYPLKHAKKWAYWQLFERHVLRDAAAVLFTCDEERRLARESFRPYACHERVVAYGTAAPRADAGRQLQAWRKMLPALGARSFWLFLGRIHPKKGVDLLLRSYGELARSAGRDWPALVIAGPSFDAIYQANLQKLADGLPAPARVFWPGMLEGDKKWGALRAADAFVLPSHQENFGIAVVEALAVGTPVLISREVNIWREIESAGAGFSERDDAAGTAQLLARWLALPSPARALMRSAAVDLFNGRYEIGRAARSLVETITPFVHPMPAVSLT